MPIYPKKILTKQQLPTVGYKNTIANASCSQEHQPVLMPRNTKQIRNLQIKHHRKFCLTYDALYNLHELAYDLDSFAFKISTFPDLLVICGLKSMLVELETISQLKLHSQLLSYDITFQLGDFYVSTLLFRHTLFSPSPVMPSCFVLHEQKFGKVFALN